jgi:hypothetical protein
MLVLETCLKYDSNMLQNCFICDHFVLEMWSKHAPELLYIVIGTWILKLGNTVCSFLKLAWNVIQTCSRIASYVIGLFLKRAWNVIQTCNFLRLRVVRRVFSCGPWKDDTPNKTTTLLQISQKCYFLLNYAIRSGSQQLTSGFSGANIGMPSAQLCGQWWKSWDKAYLNIIDPLHYM